MAEATNTTTTVTGELSRRGIGALSLAAVAALVPASAVAAAVCPADPIFMLIEGHRAAEAGFITALDCCIAFEWEHGTAVKPLPCALDYPELAELYRQAATASDASTVAAVALLTTAPTTLPGAVALLRYVAENSDVIGTAVPVAGDAFECIDGADALVASLIAGLAPLVIQ